MTDSEVTLVMLLAFMTLLFVIQTWRHRRLRKKIERIAEASAQVSAAAPQAVPQRSNEEVHELRERVKVLERIVTDGNRVLEQQIEALRHA